MTNETASARWDSTVTFTDEFWPALSEEVLGHLIGAAYLAVQRGLVDEADAIASGLMPFEPWYSELPIMRATVLVAANRPAESLALLEKLIARRPQEHSAVCACAMLKKELGLANWRPLAQSVLSHPDADADSVRAAREMLGMPAEVVAVVPAAANPAPAHQIGLRFVR